MTKSKLDDPPKGNFLHSSGFLLWSVANAWQRQIKTALAPLGLTHVQYLLLEGLNELESEVSRNPKRAAANQQYIHQNRLAQYTQTDKMMTSKVIRTLEERNLVIRQSSSHDARAILVKLSDEGAAVLSQAKPILKVAEELFFKPISKKHDKFFKHLSQLVDDSAADDE